LKIRSKLDQKRRGFVLQRFVIGPPSTITSMLVTVVDLLSLLLLIDAISPLHKLLTFLWVEPQLDQLVLVRLKQLKILEELWVFRLSYSIALTR
jgi:hypothetical protein